MPKNTGAYALTLATLTVDDMALLALALGSGISRRELERRKIIDQAALSRLVCNNWDVQAALRENNARCKKWRDEIKGKQCLNCTRPPMTSDALLCIVHALSHNFNVRRNPSHEGRYAPIHPDIDHLDTAELALMMIENAEAPTGGTGLDAWIEFGKTGQNSLYGLSREVRIGDTLYPDYYPYPTQILYDVRAESLTVRYRLRSENLLLKNFNKTGINIAHFEEMRRMLSVGYDPSREAA